MTTKQLGVSILWGILACASCSRMQNGFTEEELSLIHAADSIMHVLTINNPAEDLVLRTPSCDLPGRSLLSDDYTLLCSLMVATVRHPSQDGVGIAGPQVGLNRRVVAVQRFDKEPVTIGGKSDYPFEVYPNVRIVWASDSLAYGPEGCLSVPGRRGDVLRSQEIVIEYARVEGRDAGSGCSGKGSGSGKGDWLVKGDRPGKRQEGISMVRDTVRGFTAVIFQHEIDHLDGVLYIDRL